VITLSNTPVKFKLDIFYKKAAHDPQRVYRTMFAHAHDLGLSGDTLVDIESGKQWTLADFLANGPYVGDPAERVRWGGLYISTSHGPTEEHNGIINVWGDDLDAFADEWVRLFCGLKGFFHAYLVDFRFHTLETERYASQLSGLYKESLKKYVTYHDDYPPPKGTDFIDVRKNPGRCLARLKPEYYQEFVGGAMWFADSFWQCVGKQPDALDLKADIGTVVKFAPGVTKIVATGGAFVDRTRTRQMDALRQAIYGDSIHSFEKRTWGPSA
jgi:hypothetical protein